MGKWEKLPNKHQVLADRGFSVTDECAGHGMTLRIPSFTREKKQLNGEEVVRSREISRRRIHVERTIACLRKFRVLNSKVPLPLVKHLDDIVIVTAALTNLQKPFIKE